MTTKEIIFLLNNITCPILHDDKLIGNGIIYGRSDDHYIFVITTKHLFSHISNNEPKQINTYTIQIPIANVDELTTQNISVTFSDNNVILKHCALICINISHLKKKENEIISDMKVLKEVTKKFVLGGYLFSKQSLCNKIKYDDLVANDVKIIMNQYIQHDNKIISTNQITCDLDVLKESTFTNDFKIKINDEIKKTSNGSPIFMLSENTSHTLNDIFVEKQTEKGMMIIFFGMCDNNSTDDGKTINYIYGHELVNIIDFYCNNLYLKIKNINDDNLTHDEVII
jgi:hypothetical protein